MAITLKAARVNAGLKQADVAKAIGKSKNTVASYEAYKTKPTIETSKKLAELYSMNVNDIIFFA